MCGAGNARLSDAESSARWTMPVQAGLFFADAIAMAAAQIFERGPLLAVKPDVLALFGADQACVREVSRGSG